MFRVITDYRSGIHKLGYYNKADAWVCVEEFSDKEAAFDKARRLNGVEPSAKLLTQMQRKIKNEFY